MATEAEIRAALVVIEEHVHAPQSLVLRRELAEMILEAVDKVRVKAGGLVDEERL